MSARETYDLRMTESDPIAPLTTHLRELSPLRHTTDAGSAVDLAHEQAEHFGIDPTSAFGAQLMQLTTSLYTTNVAAHELWSITQSGLASLPRQDRIAWFNAKRFVSFQLAKILDTMQNPTRKTYQSLANTGEGFAPRGAYPVFDNVTAIFSASPVITRTATYLFACTEWVQDAFKGREPLHEIYSRLLNPTSISLANHIVDIECGPMADQYMAWNFNSGMAAIDGVLSHLLGRDDIVLASRNVYGGSFQLLHDWYAKRSNLDIALEWIDGDSETQFAAAMDKAAKTHAARLAEGRRMYIFLESPCNPHGTVLDVPGITRAAHERGATVIVDTTVGTPYLHPVLRRDDPMERPDFVVHSYTKELAGSGTTTAGCVIGRNQDMFLPKGDCIQATRPNGEPREINWDQTMFWNVYYVKGAFLDSDKAFEVLNGMKTYELRVLKKAINTMTLARVLDLNPDINVSCPALPNHPNHPMLQKHMHLGLPAALFTIDLEGKAGRTGVKPEAFKRMLDLLEPIIGMQVSLGQTNTVALCPGQTTHSELPDMALAEAGIKPSTTRIAVGLEDPRHFLAHFQQAASLAIDPTHPGFGDGFPAPSEIDRIYREVYLDVHERYMKDLVSYEELMK